MQEREFQAVGLYVTAMPDADEDPTQSPTQDSQDAAEEGEVMAKNWLRVAVVATFGMILLALGLLQAGGLIDFFAPVADTGAGQWLAFAVVALIVVGAGVWSWKLA